MKSKRKRKGKGKGKDNRCDKPPFYCEPSICKYCLYIGEGDSICDITHEIVLDNWTPTGAYMGAHCPYTNNKKTSRARLGIGANGL